MPALKISIVNVVATASIDRPVDLESPNIGEVYAFLLNSAKHP